MGGAGPFLVMSIDIRVQLKFGMTFLVYLA